MRCIHVTRQGVTPGIPVNDEKGIEVGEYDVLPHMNRCSLTDGGILYDCHLEKFPEGVFWDTCPELVEETDHMAMVLVNTRHDGKRPSWVSMDYVMLSNHVDTPLREDRRWVEALALLTPGDFLEYKPEWSDEVQYIRWMVDGMKLSIQEAKQISG